jgi:hypothetical protein
MFADIGLDQVIRNAKGMGSHTNVCAPLSQQNNLAREHVVFWSCVANTNKKAWGAHWL